MTLTELAIKRPSFIIVIFTILVGGGLLSYKQLSYELMPDFSAPLLTITTAYPGASPSTVESQVSKPLEDVLSGMENVDEVTSFSFDNASFVLLEFKASANIDDALEDAQRKINNNLSRLPEDAQNPMVAKIEPNATPVLQLSAVAKNLSDAELMRLMDDQLLPAIKQVKGVAEVQVIGGERRSFRDNLEKDKMRKLCLSMAQINQAIALSNLDFPTGKIKSSSEQITVRLTGKYKNLADLQDLVLMAKGTSSIRLRDVAEVVELRAGADARRAIGGPVDAAVGPDAYPIGENNVARLRDRVAPSLLVLGVAVTL
jgi:HAE1 family hydrophobic/amphiphilic exporter-1